jgi:hypothetical protein
LPIFRQRGQLVPLLPVTIRRLGGLELHWMAGKPQAKVLQRLTSVSPQACMLPESRAKAVAAAPFAHDWAD